MQLTEIEVDILRDSLRLMYQRKEQAADIFYDRLFEIAPQLRPMFSEDIVGQTEKTMVALGAIVGQIQQLDGSALTRDLAMRHLKYGVEAHHYRFVGKAVHSMLDEVLEEHYTPEVEAAWCKAYDLISDSMIKCAYGRTAA